MRPFNGRQDYVDEWVLTSAHLPIKIIVSLYCCSDLSESVTKLQDLSEMNPDYLTIIRHDLNNPGSSRNIALDLVDTEWVVFADSDDMVHPLVYLDWIQGVNKNIKLHVGRYKVIGNEKKISEKFFSRRMNIFNLIQLLKNPGLWRFMIKAEIAKSCEFPPLIMGEDLVFLARLNLDGKSMLFHNSICYEYRQHEMQLTRLSYRYDKLSDCLKMINTDSREYTSWFSLMISIKVIVSFVLRSTAKKNVKIGALKREFILLVKFVARKKNLLGTKE